MLLHEVVSHIRGQAGLTEGSDRDDLLAHWKRSIDEVAGKAQSSYLVRKLQRLFTESGVYESAVAAWSAYRSWQDTFTIFAEKLYGLETRYRHEHGEGFTRVRGAGGLTDTARSVTTDRWSLNDERMMDMVIEPIHSTKFILDELAKNGQRTKVMQFAKEAGSKAGGGVGAVEAQMKAFVAMGRGLTAVEKDIRGDGYAEGDQIMDHLLSTIASFKAVKSTIQPLLRAMGEAMSKAEAYSAKLVSGLLE